jgi:TatA/E family protein of Tat protein translocase
MFGMGMGELIVILVIILIVLGPSKLPSLASGLGKAMREFRKASLDIREEINKDGELSKPFRELREAMLLPPEELRRQDEMKKQAELARLEEQTRQNEARMAELRAHASGAEGAAEPPVDGAAPAAATEDAPGSMNGNPHIAALAPPPGVVAQDAPAPTSAESAPPPAAPKPA